VKIYPGVHHGFDRAGQVTAGDPNAIGGTAVLKFDAKAANDARERMVAFFREHL
jgi:dienelactone hydrolase